MEDEGLYCVCPNCGVRDYRLDSVYVGIDRSLACGEQDEDGFLIQYTCRRGVGRRVA